MSDQRLEKRIETTEGQVPVIRMIASRPPPMESFIAFSSSPYGRDPLEPLLAHHHH